MLRNGPRSRLQGHSVRRTPCLTFFRPIAAAGSEASGGGDQAARSPHRGDGRHPKAARGRGGGCGVTRPRGRGGARVGGGAAQHQVQHIW